MASERRRALFRGRVQGVGFRASTERLARSFDVQGFVRNLEDGCVEVIAEGEPQELDSFFEAIRHRFGDWVRSVDFAPVTVDAPLEDFSIRY
jgi:acylphosphatase